MCHEQWALTVIKLLRFFVLIMQLCKYVFPIGLPLYVPKNGFFGDFEGEDVKILCSNPQKALPCVNMHLLVYHVSKSVQRPDL